ncbi:MULTISPECIES: TlpA family protein disulfide reductase [Streptomyces]|uniref:TlpA family protein disulfide reductase n=1 Tax=Streptomyces TaxID=1883 RepID=UPI0022489EE7|nr:TlpA disulfide reductase family protein [Streptomyces sp. JHD 1]MCX2968906.1 TlpA disulfide reductase family protein [Streptomyces sp. JHD 1]
MSIRRALRGRFTRRVATPLAAAVAGTLLLTACEGDDVSSGNGTNYVQGTGEISTLPEDQRPKAPDLVGEDLHGQELKLTDYRGKVVVMNVWGSWCPPCRAEAPHFAEVSKELKDDGVEFVGINTRDLDVVMARKYDEGYGIEYPSFFDPSGKMVLHFPKGNLNPRAIPSTLVIDREGRIAVRALKPLSEEDLRGIIEPVLAEK